MQLNGTPRTLEDRQKEVLRTLSKSVGIEDEFDNWLALRDVL